MSKNDPAGSGCFSDLFEQTIVAGFTSAEHARGNAYTVQLPATDIEACVSLLNLTIKNAEKHKAHLG